MKSTILTAVAALLLGMQTVLAAQPKPTVLEPTKHSKAALVVVGADGREKSYSPADLETFDTYSLTTTTPWRDQPAVFEGVLLKDILAAHGLDRASSILVTAENEFATTLSRELWDSVDILVATRVDGRPHSRRHCGPIQFVIDADAFANSPLTSEANFVWMAARIEAEGR